MDIAPPPLPAENGRNYFLLFVSNVLMFQIITDAEVEVQQKQNRTRKVSDREDIKSKEPTRTVRRKILRVYEDEESNEMIDDAVSILSHESISSKLQTNQKPKRGSKKDVAVINGKEVISCSIIRPRTSLCRSKLVFLQDGNRCNQKAFQN